MKKKRKGFTLTELIAVIVILALLALIGIPAYNAIRKNTLQKQYENVVGLIETEAAKYASKKGVTLTNVQELIDEGLIETDDGENVLDPRDKSSMNCFLVEVTNDYGNYVSELIDVQECDLDKAKLDRSTINVIIEGVDSGRRDITSGEWVSENLKLSVDSSGVPVGENIIGYRWVVGNGQTSSEATITTNVTTSLITDVNLEVTTDSNHKFFANIVLRIDKEAPIIKSVSQSEGNNWSSGRDVYVEATDQSGSGIAGYYVGTEMCTSSTSFTNLEKTKYETNIASINIYNPTEYHVCVKDKVGNIREYDTELILHVKDTIAPSCVISGENTSWTKNSVTITYGCSDNESGCATSRATKNYNSTTETDTINYTIRDNAGNSRNCSEIVDIYVDTTSPNPPTTMNFVYGDWSVYPDSTWTNSNIYAGRTSSSPGPTGATDSHSGLAKYQISSDGVTWEDFDYDYTDSMYKMSTTGTHTRYFRAVDNAGNVSTSISRTAKIDKSAPTTPTITNPNGSNWSYTNFKLDVSSSDPQSGIAYYQYTYNANATTTGTSHDTYWVTFANSAKNSFTTTEFSAERNQYVYIRACNNVGLCSDKGSTMIKIDKCQSTTTSYGSWGSCSASCDWGTKSRTVTYKGISGRTCSTDTEYDDCYLKSCAPKVTVSGNIKNWICGECRDNCSTTYRALDSSGACIKTVSGSYGNTVGKVTYTSNSNTVTFTYEIRQGGNTWIGTSYWVKFIIKNSSGTEVYSKYLKEAYGASWLGGSTHTGTLSYTFATTGTYYIYIDGNSTNPGFDMNFGTITVTSS